MGTGICMYALPYVYVYVCTCTCMCIRDPVRLRLRHLYQVETELLFKVAT